MAGAGTTPAGTSAAGIGLPDDAALAPTGTGAMCRRIDPVTRDYIIDTDSLQFRAWTQVQQRVYLRLAAGVPMPGKLDERFPAEAEARVRAALRQEIEVERVVRLESVTVAMGIRRSAIHVEFTDLTTDTRHAVDI